MNLKKVIIGLVTASSILLANNYNTNKNTNVRVLEYSNNNQTLSVFVNYGKPTKIVFPAFIEKIEMIDKSNSLSINKEELSKGTDTLLLTQEEKKYKDSSYIYVTTLGKRIILDVKQSKNFDRLVKIQMSDMNKQSSNNTKKVTKKIKSKDLTRQTNIKSAELLLKMIEGNAEDYYKSINLKGIISQDTSFFDFNTKPEERVATNVYKKLFMGQPDFFALYLNRIIEPIELFVDDYVVVKSNKVKEVLNVFGMKTKWCNYSHDNAIQINIDDVKSVFGKNLLKVKHPMDKIAPRTCEYVYTIFYRK